MNGYELKTPMKWRAGEAGGRELFFPCAGCEKEDADIVGFLATAPTWDRIGVVEKGPGRHFLAMYCRACWPGALGSPTAPPPTSAPEGRA